MGILYLACSTCYNWFNVLALKYSWLKMMSNVPGLWTIFQMVRPYIFLFNHTNLRENVIDSSPSNLSGPHTPCNSLATPSKLTTERTTWPQPVILLEGLPASMLLLYQKIDLHTIGKLAKGSQHLTAATEVSNVIGKNDQGNRCSALRLTFLCQIMVIKPQMRQTPVLIAPRSQVRNSGAAGAQTSTKNWWCIHWKSAKAISHLRGWGSIWGEYLQHK